MAIIKRLSLEEDYNEYEVLVSGSVGNKKCDFYINDELTFQGIPYNNIKVLDSCYFIKIRDLQGENRIIRNGKIVFSTRYNVVNAYVQRVCDYDGRESLADTYLFVVSRNGLYGICSSKSSRGRLVLPIKYSTIDIDEMFNIVIGEKVDLDMYDDESKEDMLKYMRNGEYMRIGDYIEKYDMVDTKATRVFGDEVEVINDGGIHYIWNDGFGGYEVDDDMYANVPPSNWDNYSIEDSLYDALGGEMDAIWNID